MRVMLMLCAALALTVGVATATAGGNSPNAKLCQKNGWQTLYTSTGGTFASEQACVSYAAQGGRLVTTKSQLDCESFGGTFTAHDPVGNVWACRGMSPTDFPDLNAKLDVFRADCTADGGFLGLSLSELPGNIIVPGSFTTFCNNPF